MGAENLGRCTYLGSRRRMGTWEEMLEGNTVTHNCLLVTHLSRWWRWPLRQESWSQSQKAWVLLQLWIVL